MEYPVNIAVSYDKWLYGTMELCHRPLSSYKQRHIETISFRKKAFTMHSKKMMFVMYWLCVQMTSLHWV